jgi:hypothetical protein
MLRLTFFSTENTEVFKVNAKTIQVSKVNLLKVCKFPSCDVKVMNGANQAILKFEFEQQQSTAKKAELIDNLHYVANKYNLPFTTWCDYTGFHLSIYFKIPVANSVRTGANKKFILKDLV